METIVETNEDVGQTIVYIDLTKEYIDRFDLAKFLSFKNGRYTCNNSYFLYKLMQLPILGYYKVNQEIMRADTISYNIFDQNEEFWWLILYYNKITKYQDLKEGMILKIFDSIDLERLINKLAIKQQIFDQG